MDDDTETIVPVVCFLVDTGSITTVAGLKGIETGESESNRRAECICQ